MSQLAIQEFFEDEIDPVAPVSQKARKRKLKKLEKAVKQDRRNPKPLTPRTTMQAMYVASLTQNELTFGVGPAGVGKTYVPARVYGAMLANGEITKLYIARPNVAKKRHQNGFLPGTLEEKTAPWLVPIYEGLKESMGPAVFDQMRRDKKIEEVPYEYMQGRTFKNAACIIDEAENLDLDDLYITLTRQGEDLLMCLCGDIYQSRIPDSGLQRVIDMAQREEMESVGVIVFTEEDVVRSRQAKQWVRAFRRHETLQIEEDCATFYGTTTPTFLQGNG